MAEPTGPKPGQPTARRCERLDVHEGHEFKPGNRGWKVYWCKGLKHRSKARGVPLAERLARGNPAKRRESGA